METLRDACVGEDVWTAQWKLPFSLALREFQSDAGIWAV